MNLGNSYSESIILLLRLLTYQLLSIFRSRQQQEELSRFNIATTRALKRKKEVKA